MSVETVVTSDPLSSPKICMLSCYCPNYREMADKTLYQNKAEYAKRWGHDLMTLTDVNPEFKDEKSHVGGLTWDRLRESIKIAKSGKYEWIYIVGVDTLITNLTIPLSSFVDPEFHLVIANDCCGWNADSFLFRCSEQGISYMEDVMAHYEQFKHHCWVEQQAMIELRDAHPGTWKVLPQRLLNSYDYELYPAKGGREGKDFAGNDGQWQPGDFLIHWAGLPTHVRYEQIEKVWPQIVK